MLVDKALFLRDGGSNIFRRRRIRHAAERPHRGHRPRGALVGEGERLVVMKGVDHIRVRHRFEGEQIGEAGVVAGRRDDGVMWRSLADGGDGLRLHRVPLLRVCELRLVQHLKEDALGIGLRVVAGQRAP